MGVGISVCRSSLTKMVSSDEQGKLSALAGILQMFSTLVATITCNAIYKATVHITPSFIYFFLTGLAVIPVLFSILLKVCEQRTVNCHEEILNDDAIGSQNRIEDTEHTIYA